MLGIDIVEVSRIEKAIQRTPMMVYNVFTEKELEYINSKKNKYVTMAGRWAAKEAYKKAININETFLNIEVLNDENGKPNIYINNLLEDNIVVSISHENNYAVAVVMKK